MSATTVSHKKGVRLVVGELRVMAKDLRRRWQELSSLTHEKVPIYGVVSDGATTKQKIIGYKHLISYEWTTEN